VCKRKIGRACAQLVINEDLKLRETEKKDRNGNKAENIANNNIKMLYYCIVYVKENEREKNGSIDVELDHDIDVWIKWTLALEKIYINIHPIIIR